MKFGSGRTSDNVEDRRGAGGGMRMPGGRTGGFGLIGLVIAVVLILMGADPRKVLGLLSGGGGPQTPGTERSAPPPPADDADAKFVSMVLADTEQTWDGIFSAAGARYEQPKLVLFSGATPTACGTGDSAMGPFYCPGDRKVYIDLDFYRELRDRFRAPGDFAQAYVIAHEVGHHVQNLTGVSEKVSRARRALSEEEGNALSVKLELQADCYAGVWAHHAQAARQVLEQGDVEEGLNAAAAIGDDTLQKRAQGYAVPESFTHGSAAQRAEWFRRGMQDGDVQSCDTFARR